MVKLKINPLVVKDLKEIRNYIAENNPQKAVEVVRFPSDSLGISM